jgi:glycosyltransferase involved in cell wall biosynthesis
MSVSPKLSLLIVAEYASMAMAGEPRLPLHYYRILRSRGVDVHLLVHERNREELLALFPEDADRLHFSSDIWLHRLLWSIHRLLPERLSWFTAGTAMRLLTQCLQSRMAKTIIRRHRINLVHLPIPVTPREPLAIYDLGAPMVIGPMNGGMSYPKGWQSYGNPGVNFFMRFGRPVSRALNRLIPGKLRAQLLLVANARTRSALPGGLTMPVVELSENGVDLRLWTGEARSLSGQSVEVPHFVFMGRLILWKGVDMLLEAFAALVQNQSASLTIIGDGDELPQLMALATSLGLDWSLDGEQAGRANQVTFVGWRSQAEAADIFRRSDVFVLPSLLESGGAVILEAMAMGLPVIAADWGGPADYVDPHCGMLIATDNRPQLIDDLAVAMLCLIESPELRQRLGMTGRLRVYRDYDWERKVDRMVELYDGLLAERSQRSDQGQLVKNKKQALVGTSP